MTVVPFVCVIPSCRFHHLILHAEIVQIKVHIKTHDYKILLETAHNLGIIDNLDERRGLDWIVDELSKAGRIAAAGVPIL